MSIVVTPIPRLIDLTAPAFTLGTANAAGSAITAVASDSTLLAFDTTVPDAITFGQSGAAGSATVTSRRDHSHAMAADPANLVLIGSTNVTSNVGDVTITGLTTTYSTYMVTLDSMVPTSDGPYTYFQVGPSGGIDDSSGDYNWHLMELLASTTTPSNYAAVGGTDGVAIRLFSLGVGSDTGEGFSATIWVHYKNDTDSDQLVRVHGNFASRSYVPNTTGGIFIGERTAAIALTQLRFKFHAGSVESGRMSVYGVNHT